MNENTPLLSSNDAPTLILQTPYIETALRRVVTSDVNQIRLEDVSYDGLDLNNYPAKVAFALVVLFYLRMKKREAPTTNDIYDHWLAHETDARHIKAVDDLIMDIWCQRFLNEYRSAHDIQTVLWTPFTTKEGSDNSYRVVDFLVQHDYPAPLLSHPIIIAGIEDAWKHRARLQNYHSSTLLARYDGLSAPRVIHFIDWVSHIIFFALLVHYLLYPIEAPHTSEGWPWYNYGPREAFLILLSLSFTTYSRSSVNTSSLLVPLAFLTSMPSVPHPASTSFIFLQWAAFLQPLGLNFPQAPSHLFFLPHNYSLPIAVLINQGLSRIAYPAIVFFLPLLLVAIYLLSLSLADAFFRLLSLNANLTLPPLETRFTFLCFFATVLVLLLASISILAINSPSTSHPIDSWDRYSIHVGLSARRTIISATVLYSNPFTFPPPFNLVHVLIVQLPRNISRRLGHHFAHLETLERITWRLLVGPCCALISAFLWRPGRASSLTYPHSP